MKLRALWVALVCAAMPAVAAPILYVYDELGRLVAEINPAAETTLYHYDAAGNLLAVARGASSDFRLIAFSPSRGKSGDAVWIYGSGFIADPAQNQVFFNGAPAVVSAATANALLVTVPAGASTGAIGVSNAHGSALSAQAFVVTFAPVIGAVAPAFVPRGATSRITISGAHLATARAVAFEQAGMAARVVPGASDAQMTIDLAVAGTVPTGSYPFSVTTDGGATPSGTVTINVTTSLVGDVQAVSPTVSVHRRLIDPNTPAGNAMSLTVPVSVHVRAAALGLPAGNSMAVSQLVAVHLRAAVAGLPAGNSMAVTQPVSVLMP